MLKLQAVELSKSYRGRKVVDDVELEIGQGEVVGLLGPNGRKDDNVLHSRRSRPAGLRPRAAERRRNHRLAHVSPSPKWDQLSPSGTLGISTTYKRRESARGAGNPPAHA